MALKKKKKKKSGLIWDIRCYFEYVGCRLLMILIEQIPVRPLYKLADVIGWLSYYLDVKHRKRFEDNIAIVYPQGPPVPKEVLGKEVFAHLVKLVFETILSRRLINKYTWHRYIKINPDEVERSQRIVQEGKGVIFVTGHVGNFEVLGAFFGFLNMPLNSVARPIDNYLINSFYGKFRERCGQRIIFKKGAFQTLVEVLKKGGCLGLLMDQDAGSDGFFIDFMGVKASTTRGPAFLSLTTGAPIISGTLFRTGMFRFELKINLPLNIELTGDDNIDAPNLISAATKDIEGFIHEHPEQWMWVHRRWKSSLPDITMTGINKES